MSKNLKIALALIAGGLCGVAIPAAVIWPANAIAIGIAAGSIASLAAIVTGVTVTKA